MGDDRRDQAARAQALLADLRALVLDEQAAARAKALAVWQRPLVEKLASGWTQRFVRLEPADDAESLWALIGDDESRFREGDLLVLHQDDSATRTLARSLSFEQEEEGRWLLRGRDVATLWHAHGGGPCFADPDTLDLTPHYERALDDVATSDIGRNVILPLLTGETQPGFYEAERQQAEAIARLMAERGERLLITSHTHLAINNALNRIADEGVPVVKVGRPQQRQGLAPAIRCVGALHAWAERPTNGYAIGATPLATCTERLENYHFDTVLLDEASQATILVDEARWSMVTTSPCERSTRSSPPSWGARQSGG